MKKLFYLVFVIATVFFIGNTKVNASTSSYWENYFKDRPLPSSKYGLQKWQNKSTEYWMIGADYPVGSCEGPRFSPRYYSNYYLFSDVTNPKVKSSDENVFTAQIREYDFKKEKENYDNYIKDWNSMSLKDFEKKYTELMLTCGEISEEEFNKTWWEYNGFSVEPSTWWEAYGLDSEPINTYEVIPYTKDFGKYTLTLSADGKSDITLDYTVGINDFTTESKDFFNPFIPLWGGQGYLLDYAKSKNKAQGFADILNNWDKYKWMINTHKASNYYNDGTYDFRYPISDNEDLSAIINALRGKDITVNFVKGGSYTDTFVSYVLNGKDITKNVEKGFTYDVKVSTEASVNKKNIESLIEAPKKIFIDFSYHGILPAPYTATINLNYYNISDIGNKTFTVLYYNPEKNMMEEVYKNLKADSNGNLQLTFDHFSTYVIVGDNDYKYIDGTQVATKLSNNAQTSSMNIIFYITLSLSSLIGIAYIIRKKKIA